jgi:hypothetical protein
MQAYGRISARIFGSASIRDSLKFVFARTLVFSRLFSNTHTWAPKKSELKTLNGAYMRVIRRIAGEMRFTDVNLTDGEVRAKVGQPSVDCVLLRARLQYVGRLVVQTPAAVSPFLAFRKDGKSLKWVAQVHHDFRVLLDESPKATSFLPSIDRLVEWPAWIIANRDKWKKLVSETFFVASILDRVAGEGLAPGTIAPFRCQLCEPAVAFRSTVGLAQHSRIKHNVRCEWRQFADKDGKCAACGMVFHTRLRLLRHILCVRRPKCLDWLKVHGTPLSAERVAELDEEDKVLRRAAQRAGKSGVVATRPAVDAFGKESGRIRTAPV